MKKVVGVVAVLLLIVAVAAPYAIGYRTEQLFRQHARKISKHVASRTDGKVSIKLTNYNLGYMHSTARTRVQINGHAYIIDHDITHGPYLVFGWARIHSHPDFSDQAKQVVGRLFNGPMLIANTKVGFFGGTTVHVHVSALRHPLSSHNVQINWQGMDADYKHSGNSSHFKAKIPAVSINQVSGQVAMSNIKLHGSHSGPSRWQHHARVSIQRLGLTDGKGKHVSGRIGLRVSQTPTHGGKQVNTNLRTTLKNLKLTPTDKPDAKTTHINRLKFNWNLNGLDTDGLSKFAHALQAQMRRDRGRNSSPDQFNQQFLNLAERYGPDVLTPDTQIKIAVPTLKMPAGQANAKLDVALSGNGKPQINIVSLLQRLKISLHAAADTKLVKHVMAQSLPERSIQLRLAMLQSRNIIQQHNHRYTLAFHYGNGSYTLNGKPANGLISALMRQAPNE